MNYFTHNRGMTIVEMLVTIGVSSMIMIAIVGSVVYFYQTNSNVIEQAYHVNHARKGIEQLTRDIREAAYSDDGAFPVIAIAPNAFSFYSDIDRDANTERIRYYLQDGFLYKGVTNPSGAPIEYDDDDEVVSAVSEAVRNIEESVSVFRYFDSGGEEITDFGAVSDVAFVRVTLIVNINPERKPREFTLTGSATLRNLKVNL